MLDAEARCDEYFRNGDIPHADIVRFDERENAMIVGPILIGPPLPVPRFSATQSVSPMNSTSFPANTSTDVGGWMYFNLNNGGAAAGARYGSRNVSQNWVATSFFAEGRDGTRQRMFSADRSEQDEKYRTRSEQLMKTLLALLVPTRHPDLARFIHSRQFD